MSVHKDSERAERQYLLHIGTDISSEAFQKSPSPFDELKEARDIFAIISDLYASAGKNPDSFSYMMLNQLEYRVSLKENDS